MSDEKMDKARAIRRQVLGSDYTDRTAKNRNDFNAEFQDFVIEHVWGALWTRPLFEPRQRSILTIAILAATGKVDELKMHIHASLNTGVTREEMRETMMHVMVYAGAPAGNSAMQVANQVYAEQDKAKS